MSDCRGISALLETSGQSRFDDYGMQCTTGKRRMASARYERYGGRNVEREKADYFCSVMRASVGCQQICPFLPWRRHRRSRTPPLPRRVRRGLVTLQYPALGEGVAPIKYRDVKSRGWSRSRLTSRKLPIATPCLLRVELTLPLRLGLLPAGLGVLPPPVLLDLARLEHLALELDSRMHALRHMPAFRDTAHSRV